MDGDIGIDYIDLFIIGIIGIMVHKNNPSYNVIWNSSRENGLMLKDQEEVEIQIMVEIVT